MFAQYSGENEIIHQLTLVSYYVQKLNAYAWISKLILC